MKPFPVILRLTLWLLLILFLIGPSLGEEQATSGSSGTFRQAQQMIDDGTLVPHWVGQGRVAGDIVELTLENTKDQAIAITLESGTVLELQDPELAKKYQPILLEETVTLLAPALGKTTRMLRGYCLNYELDPPEKGRDLPYKFPENTIAYAPAIAVLKASLTYDAEKNVLPVQRQRTLVIQRAIWTALGQMTKEKLLEDILLDAAAEGKTLSPEQAQQLADVIWEEVERLLKIVP